MVGRQNADTADTLQLRDVAMVTDCGTTLAAYFLWTLTADNGMRLSYKVWCAFNQPVSVGCAVWIRTRGGRNCSRRATVRLGIDTLIANILVYFGDHFVASEVRRRRRHCSVCRQ